MYGCCVDIASGVQGAILFLQTKALSYKEHFNILVCPCISPWGYGTNNLNNPNNPNIAYIN